MRVLVVGATGVAGGAAIAAVRQCFGTQAVITGVWHGPAGETGPEDLVDLAITGDIADPATLDTVHSQAGDSFDVLFFATARGDVGFPIEDASPGQIAEADAISFLPILACESRFHIGRIVGYSTFFTLAHQRINYGAMGHSKARLEAWVAQAGGSRRACIRAGAFPSPSSRAIKLLLRRNAKVLATSANPLLRSFFDGAKPSEAVEQLEAAIQEEERQTYGDTGTRAEHLLRAHLTLLENPEAMFVNVCGERIWISNTPLAL